jgi:hypothetical protein
MINRDNQIRKWMSGEVAKLQSESQQEDGLSLREAINDKDLMSVPTYIFTRHMQYFHLQKSQTIVPSEGVVRSVLNMGDMSYANE